jgi:hypothetical protein
MAVAVVLGSRTELPEWRKEGRRSKKTGKREWRFVTVTVERRKVTVVATIEGDLLREDDDEKGKYAGRVWTLSMSVSVFQPKFAALLCVSVHNQPQARHVS